MKNTYDVIGALLLFAISLLAGIGSISLRVGLPTEPQPGFFPFIGSMVLLLFSVIIFFQGVLGRQKVRPPGGNVGRPLLLVVVMVALVAALNPLGYVISTLIASGCILRIMGVKSWKVLIVTSLSLSIGSYLLFDKLLGVELPIGILARMGL